MNVDCRSNLSINSKVMAGGSERNYLIIDPEAPEEGGIVIAVSNSIREREGESGNLELLERINFTLTGETDREGRLLFSVASLCTRLDRAKLLADFNLVAKEVFILRTTVSGRILRCSALLRGGMELSHIGTSQELQEVNGELGFLITNSAPLVGISLPQSLIFQMSIINLSDDTPLSDTKIVLKLSIVRKGNAV